MSQHQTSNWISLSDMMTGLMLVFMLISILMISQVVERENERKELIDEYDQSREQIYNELDQHFGDKKEEWKVPQTLHTL